MGQGEEGAVLSVSSAHGTWVWVGSEKPLFASCILSRKASCYWSAMLTTSLQWGAWGYLPSQKTMELLPSLVTWNRTVAVVVAAEKKDTVMAAAACSWSLASLEHVNPRIYFKPFESLYSSALWLWYVLLKHQQSMLLQCPLCICLHCALQ